MVVPLVLVHTDQGRWFYDMVFSLFFIVFVVLLADGKNAVNAVNKTVKFSPVEMLFLIMYFVIFMFPDKQCISIMNFYMFDRIFSLGLI